MMNSSSAILVVAVTAGCAIGPPVTSSAPRIHAPRQGEAASSIQAPAQIPTGPVLLDDLTAYARANAPRSIVADATTYLPAAEVAASRQRALYNPVVRVALGARTQARDTGLEAQVGIRQRIEIAGERRVRIETAQRLVEQVEREQAATLWEVEVEVRRLYGLALILEDLASLTAESAAAARELAKATGKKVDAGDEPTLAAELAQARAALIDASTRAVKAEHDAVIGQLSAASGWPRDEALVLAATPRATPSLPSDRVLTDLAFDNNRDRAALQTSIARATASRKLAKREAWPEPIIGAGYAREAGVANNQPADVVRGTLSVPIPSFARNQAGRARARADERRSKAALLAFERGIPGEVKESVARVRGALGRIDALAAVSTARDARRMSALREAYDAGEVSLLEVLRALEQSIETRTAALAAEADYVNALAGLELLVGKRLDQRGDRR